VPWQNLSNQNLFLKAESVSSTKVNGVFLFWKHFLKFLRIFLRIKQLLSFEMKSPSPPDRYAEKVHIVSFDSYVT